MPVPLQPIFLKSAERATPATEDDALRRAAAQTRSSYLAGLAADPAFIEHVLNGWFHEQETQALAEMEICAAAGLVSARATWKATKDLRQNLTNTLDGAKAQASGAAA
jgi:hypothetical protein